MPQASPRRCGGRPVTALSSPRGRPLCRMVAPRHRRGGIDPAMDARYRRSRMLAGTVGCAAPRLPALAPPPAGRVAASPHRALRATFERAAISSPPPRSSMLLAKGGVFRLAGMRGAGQRQVRGRRSRAHRPRRFPPAAAPGMTLIAERRKDRPARYRPAPEPCRHRRRARRTAPRDAGLSTSPPRVTSHQNRIGHCSSALSRGRSP